MERTASLNALHLVLKAYFVIIDKVINFVKDSGFFGVTVDDLLNPHNNQPGPVTVEDKTVTKK